MSEQENDFLSEYADEDKAAEIPDEPEQPAEDENAETVEKPDETEQGAAPEAHDEPDKPEAPTATETHEEERVPLAALKAEREKRQRFEREKQELERRIAEAEKQNEPKPEIWDDPDGFVTQRVQALEQQFNGRLYGALEAAARETYPDYDEVFATVEEEARNNPAIKHEVFSSPNPAVAAYKLGKRLQEFKQMQDPEAYKAKIKAELMAEIKAEQEAEAKRKKAAADAIPPDLSSSRSVKGEDVPASEDVFDNMF